METRPKTDYSFLQKSLTEEDKETPSCSKGSKLMLTVFKAVASSSRKQDSLVKKVLQTRAWIF